MDPELKQEVLDALQSLEWHVSVDQEWARKDHTVGDELRDEAMSEMDEEMNRLSTLINDVRNAPTTENMGVIPLDWVHTFNWIRQRDGEIFGHVEKLGGDIVPKSDGFYRTHDPKIAEFYARGHVPKEEQNAG